MPKYTVTYDDDRLMIHEDGSKRGLILAHTREVAERYAAEMARRKGVKPVVADVRGDTDIPVAGLLNMIVESYRANCALVIRSVAEDGETKWDYIYPVKPPAK